MRGHSSSLPGPPTTPQRESYPARAPSSNTFSYFPRLDPFHVRLPFQSLPTGVPDDRLKLRVTIDQKYQQVPIDLQREKQPLVSNGNLSAQSRRQGVSICPQQLTPPAKVLALCQLTNYLDLEFGSFFQPLCTSAKPHSIGPVQVPSSPTCSSPERGGEQDSLYGDGYTKIYNRLLSTFLPPAHTTSVARLEGWGAGQYQSYQERYNSQFYAQVGQAI